MLQTLLQLPDLFRLQKSSRVRRRQRKCHAKGRAANRQIDRMQVAFESIDQGA